MKKITLYCDGACSGNPGPGGYGTILIYKEHKKELSGFFEETTNNRMELFALIKGLLALKEPCIVDVYTDSAYLFNAFDRGWIISWQNNGWKTSSKKPVENQDLWHEIVNQTKQHTINWHKVKGHADNELNNRCDELARKAIKEGLKE